MAGFSVVGSRYGGAGARKLSGISDLEIYEKDGVEYLIVANSGTGHMQIYDLYTDQVMELKDVGFADEENGGTFNVSDIDLIAIDGFDYLLTSGPYDDNAGLYPLRGVDPEIERPTAIVGDAADYANFTRTLVVIIAGKTFVLVSKRGDNHLYSYLVTDEGDFLEASSAGDDDTVTLGDITDFVSVIIQGKTFVAVTSAFDGGVTMYRISENGVLSYRDTVFPADGGGFTYPQEISFVEAGGNTYLIMIAAGTSTITVYGVGNAGRLQEVDHTIDTLSTRFEGASQLETITHNGRSFVFVAGNDDGITVFELLADGNLLHVLTYEDNFDVALTNVSAITLTIIEGKIHVFVAGAEDGVTQFIFDPDALGDSIVGTTGKDVISGTAFDDYLFGGRRGDTIDGGAGDDRIDGGGGKDYLTGAAGADTFVFVADGRNDFIMDFEDGTDRIDLSGYDQIGTLDDLTIKTRAWGVLIEIRGEKLKVIADGSDVLTADDFTADDFIF